MRPGAVGRQVVSTTVASSVHSVGYSGTPLLKKLGWKAPLQVWVRGAPADYADWLGPLPEGLELVEQVPTPLQAAHLFVCQREVLAQELQLLRTQLQTNGWVWVSWPKKASKVATDITEDTVRELALPLGWVDVKVCAVSAVWSGLKLVVRKQYR